MCPLIKELVYFLWRSCQYDNTVWAFFSLVEGIRVTYYVQPVLSIAYQEVLVLQLQSGSVNEV